MLRSMIKHIQGKKATRIGSSSIHLISLLALLLASCGSKQPRIAVETWTQTGGLAFLQVSGSIRNISDEPLSDLVVMINFEDEAGHIFYTQETPIYSSILEPGDTASFDLFVNTSLIQQLDPETTRIIPYFRFAQDNATDPKWIEWRNDTGGE